MLFDPFQNSIRVFKHVSIFQAEHRQSGFAKKSGASRVSRSGMLTVVCRSIQLNNKSLSRTIEIDYIGPNTLLAPEFSTLEL